MYCKTYVSRITNAIFAQKCQLEKMHAEGILIFYKSLLNCRRCILFFKIPGKTAVLPLMGPLNYILLTIESIQIYLNPTLANQ